MLISLQNTQSASELSRHVREEVCELLLDRADVRHLAEVSVVEEHLIVAMTAKVHDGANTKEKFLLVVRHADDVSCNDVQCNQSISDHRHRKLRLTKFANALDVNLLAVEVERLVAVVELSEECVHFQVTDDQFYKKSRRQCYTRGWY